MLVAVACSGNNHGERVVDHARQMCEAAYPRATVVDSFSTTVGDVRGRRMGPSAQQPAAAAWSRLNDGDRAAWCYVDGAAPQRIVAAVATGGNPVVFAQGSFEPNPDGPRVP